MEPAPTSTVSASLAHPAVARLLQVYASTTPQAAPAAANALGVLLAGVGASPWGEVAWRFSTLTGGGFPLEVTCSSADEVIRFTGEVGGPEVDESARLGLALRLCEQLQSAKIPEAFQRRLQALQTGQPLRYGAWLGGRISAEASQYKIYLETPPDTQVTALEFAGWAGIFLPRLNHRPTSLRLLGFTPANGYLEFYFRTPQLERWELAQLLRQAGMPASQLLDFAEQVAGSRLDAALLGVQTGFSLAVRPGAPPVFTLLLAARNVFGGDSAIRRGLLALAEQAGWQFDAYAQVSAPLADRDLWQTYHSALALVLPPSGQPWLQVGLRPPE